MQELHQKSHIKEAIPSDYNDCKRLKLETHPVASLSQPIMKEVKDEAMTSKSELKHELEVHVI